MGGRGSKSRIEIRKKQPPAEAKIEEERSETPEEPDLEDLFGDLWSGSATEEEILGTVPETVEPEEDTSGIGRYGIPESKYPADIRLTDYDRSRLEAIEKYWDSSYKLPDDMVAIHDDELRLARGDTGFYSASQLAADRERQEERIRIANDAIADRKASGYKGASREESYAKWKSIRRSLDEADEVEKGDVLKMARVGERGIRYWQRERKAAERELKRIDFTEKLYKRFTFARSV